MRETPLEQVRHEIDACLEGVPIVDPGIERQLRSREAAVLLADLLALLWHAVLAPDWPRLRDLLERDVLHRSRLLARGGLASLFADLEPISTLRERTLTVDLRTEGTIVLDGQGLRLMPSAFVCAGALTMDDTPPTLIYPSRGVASLFWTSADTDGAVAKLIGATRAEILELVGEPNHTSALARGLGRSPGNIADRLKVCTRAVSSRVLAWDEPCCIRGRRSPRRSSRARSRPCSRSRAAASARSHIRPGTNALTGRSSSRHLVADGGG